jgi:hypothetical protein
MSCTYWSGPCRCQEECAVLGCRDTRGEQLVSRTFPDRRRGERRQPIDTRVDIDPTQEWLGEKDRRHRERRQYASTPAPHSAFGRLAK